jgi:hypothetical protein
MLVPCTGFGLVVLVDEFGTMLFIKKFGTVAKSVPRRGVADEEGKAVRSDGKEDECWGMLGACKSGGRDTWHQRLAVV